MLTAAQLEERRHGIGGSDAGSVLGLNPYRTPLDLYLEKVGDRSPPDLSDNESVRWGTLLEDLVAREFADRTGLKVRRRNQTLRHREHDFMLAHIDRHIVGEPVGLEVKTTGFFAGKALGDDGSDEVPDQWLAQVAHYLEVTGFDAFYIAALVGGQQLRIFRIERNPDLAKMLVERERWFWEECVQKRMPPPPTTFEDLKALHPTDDGSVVTATPEVLEAVDRLREVKAQAKEIDTETKDLELRIKTHLGDAAALTDEAGKTLATWKTQQSTRLDQKALKAEEPDTFERFQTTSSMRVLRVK